MKNGYDNVYGTWEVTTEGDCEGRSVRNLGTYTGYVDEIAFHLADKVFYSLEFEKVEPVREYVPKSDEVNVKFHIKSGTWPSPNIDELREIFSDRDVEVEDGNYYASFDLKSTKDEPVDLEKEKRREMYLELKKEFEE